MALVKSFDQCLTDSPVHLRPPIAVGNHGRRNARLKPPQAAFMPSFHLPMRSSEVKNRRWKRLLDAKGCRMLGELEKKNFGAQAAVD